MSFNIEINDKELIDNKNEDDNDKSPNLFSNRIDLQQQYLNNSNFLNNNNLELIDENI